MDIVSIIKIVASDKTRIDRVHNMMNGSKNVDQYVELYVNDYISHIKALFEEHNINDLDIYLLKKKLKQDEALFDNGYTVNNFLKNLKKVIITSADNKIKEMLNS